MTKPNIFDKRLLIVSGKGGVGKSTICSALALAASRQDKRVLLIEMDEKERISRLFGSQTVGYEGADVYPNIFARNLLPMRVMDEFVETRVAMKRVAKQIIGSQIYRYFVAAAPGLKEFVTLGKIAMLEEEKQSDGRPLYDIIIVDAPATGHGVAFLRVPFAAADTLNVGWVRKQADIIIDLITDPTKTLLNIATLPEEMPVNETMEMCESVEHLLGIPIGYIIVNSVFPQVLKKRQMDVYNVMKERVRGKGLRSLSKGEREYVDVMFECLEAAMRRRELNEFYISKLKRKLAYDFMQVPYIFTKSFDLHLIEQVCDHLTSSLKKRQRN